MSSLYEISSEAQNDLLEIWCHIAEDDIDLADRIEREFHDLFVSLARHPSLGHKRRDLTDKAVLFFPLYSFLIVYQAELKPIRIMAVLRGKRDVRRLLKGRPEV